ncbi:hypothetical protein O181_126603 [Austropuccinia psidii MF-1]|uniref:Uncharacterized protein n=1 Tax=Austropuccinia psidii MF-1 TaxID=1389203 RepID=A0A9Q3KRN4_9BASI|nr:hypothetical protein [Austropuccinia psidii MF-1]
MTSAPPADHLPPLSCLLSQMNWLPHPPHHLSQLQMLMIRQRCPSAPGTTSLPQPILMLLPPAPYLAYVPAVAYRYTSSHATPSLPSPILTLPHPCHLPCLHSPSSL